MADKSPAFQFYPRDFLSSDSVSLMTNEQIGAYVLLLCHAWNSPEGLPGAPSSLAKLARMTTSRFTNNVWPAIRGQFYADENGYWFNDRLELERRKQATFRASASRAGKRSGEQRALNGRSISVDVPLNVRSHSVAPPLAVPLNGNPTLLSSSSSASASTTTQNVVVAGAVAPHQQPPLRTQPIFGRRNPDLMTYGPIPLWASQFRDVILPLAATSVGGDRDKADGLARAWVGELDAANQATTPTVEDVKAPARWWSAQAAQRWGVEAMDRGVENILRGIAESEAREQARKAAR